MGEIKDIKEVGGELVYSRSNQNPRTCILVKKDFRILPLMHYCSSDLSQIKTLCGKGPREIILGSACLPYEYFEPTPPREMENLVVGCRANRSHLVIGCDAIAHHTTWGVKILTTEVSPCLIFYG